MNVKTVVASCFSKPKPARADSEKLLQIRLALNISPTELRHRLDLADELFYTTISGNELGSREPTLRELLGSAQLANV